MSAEGWAIIIGAFFTGLTGLVVAILSKLQASKADRRAGEADKTAAKAEKAADIGSQRITNVAQAQNALRSDLTHVASQLPPAPWYPPSTPTPPPDDGGNPRG